MAKASAAEPAPDANNNNHPVVENDDDEDDYLNMALPDTTAPESLVERKKRQQREAESRAHPKSKAELAAEADAKRHQGLSTSTFDSGNKGARMMAKLGYVPGEALGKREGGGGAGLKEPVGLEMKEGRSGVGADSEKKRKIREEFERREEGVKRAKGEEVGFRERQRLEREGKRTEGMVLGAMKVCERLEEEDAMRGGGEGRVLDKRPLKVVNVLWRGLVKGRKEVERERKMRFDLQPSLSRRVDPEEDDDDRVARGAEVEDEELDMEDEELDVFEALEPAERLGKLVGFLREKWWYCFWCKCRYPDEEMEGCPGLTEEDHD